jgi:hypothetical protein
MGAYHRRRSPTRRHHWVLINWQLAPMTTLMYFCVGWAAERGQKHRRETDAYREEWLNKRKSEGAEPEA